MLASRSQILDVLELEARGADDAVAAEGLDGTVQFLSDLCHTQAAQAAGEVSRICAELVFGYNRHPAWDEEGATAASSPANSKSTKRPCPASPPWPSMSWPPTAPIRKGRPLRRLRRHSDFLRLQNKLTTCLSGSRLAKDRAADTVSKVMIPEALDYPA